MSPRTEREREQENTLLDEEHSALRVLMRWIEAELEREAGSLDGLRGDGPLLAPLRAFRSHLDKHFEFEESGDVLPPLLLRLPGGAFESWKSEHRAFLGRLDDGIRSLEEARGGTLPAPQQQILRRVFDDLRRHDARENALLEEARREAFRSSQQGYERKA